MKKVVSTLRAVLVTGEYRIRNKHVAKVLEWQLPIIYVPFKSWTQEDKFESS